MLDKENIEYVIYCRKSTDESSWKQTQSIPDQITRCIEHANRKGLRIRKKPTNFIFEDEKEIKKENSSKHSQIYKETRNLYIVKEQKSAKEPWIRYKRNSLIQLVEKWAIKWIISYSPDRQARNMVDWWVIIHLAHNQKVDLEYANFAFENNAWWRMMLWIWFVFSKQYSDKLSEDILRWCKTRVLSWSAMAVQKFWYRINDEWYHEPHPQYFDLFKKAFYYKLECWWSSTRICTFLNNEWFKRFARDGTELSVEIKNFTHVRIDPFYYGHFVYWKQSTDLRETNPYFEPMISEEDHKKLLIRRKKFDGFIRKDTEKYIELKPIPEQYGFFTDWKWKKMSRNLPKKHQRLRHYYKALERNPKTNILKYYDVLWSNYKSWNISIWYRDVHAYIVKLLSKIKFPYEKFIEYMNTLDPTSNNEVTIDEIKWELQKTQDALNTYVDTHMWRYDEWSIEYSLYEEKKLWYRKTIDELNRKLQSSLNVWKSYRAREAKVFAWMLENIDKHYINANPVRKSQILSIFLSNLTVSNKKRLKHRVKPWFDIPFLWLVRFGGDEEIRTPVWKS